MIPKIKSPLRYPGGKQKALRQIIPYIPESIGEYREPFIGGGSVFLAIKQLFDEQIKKYWMLESRLAIKPSPSPTKPYVRLSPHTAPRYIRGLTLAHVMIVVAGFVYCYKILGFPVLMVSIYMV